ncbi:MAG: hypothetical protein H0W61_07065 [Bacteroidetes bacterium]|nr:hypothetical protein [Bacteroidota bacterium]
MKHILVIDDRSKANKAFFEHAKEFAKQNKGIYVDKAAVDFIEEAEDDLLVKEMKKAAKSGIMNDKQQSAFLGKLKKRTK